MASALGLVLEGQGHGYKAGTSVFHLTFLLHGWPGGPGATEHPRFPHSTRFAVLAVDPRSQRLTPGHLQFKWPPHPLQGQLLLGAVGAFDWSGGVLLYDRHSCQGRFLNQTVVDSKAGKHSYLGEGGARRPPG